MPIPKPEFYFIVTGLTVKFYDLTINSPVSWLWDFGDTTTSTSQNPTKTYASAGVYNVRLTSTNTDGSQDVIKIIFTSAIPNTLGIGIDDFVRLNLPATLTLVPTLIPDLKKKWQLLLFEAVPSDWVFTNIYDETNWPNDLWNLLISYCIIYDIFLILTQEGYIGTLQLNASENVTSGNSTSGGGGVKRLVEGPAEAEWTDLSSQLINMFKTSADGSTPFMALMQQGCMIANKLTVKVPFCKALKVPMLFLITDPPCTHKIPRSIWTG